MNKFKMGKLELPSRIKVDGSDDDPCYARFVAEPFERGYGTTVGNALRRILLTSMEAPGIISVCIDGVPHEYSSIEGVVEDVTHIILNIKGSLLRKIPIQESDSFRDVFSISKEIVVTEEMLLREGGKHNVVLKEIMGDSDFDLVNPEHLICTVTKPLRKRFQFKVGYGRGYVLSERHNLPNREENEIPIDTAFSPVRLVNWYVESTRVGQNTDYDRLIIDLKTDGRILPDEAISFASQVAIIHFKVFDSFQKYEISFPADEVIKQADRDALLSKLSLSTDQIEFSVRSGNCLSASGIANLGQLVVKEEGELLGVRNFGRKSLYEIKEKLATMGLSLGMDLSRFGIGRENIQQIIDDYLIHKNQEEGAKEV